MKYITLFPFTALAMAGGLSAAVLASTKSQTPVETTTQGDWFSDLGIGVQAGNHGVGVHLSYDLMSSFYVGLEGNYIGYRDTVKIHGADYSGDVDFSNIGVTANYLPYQDSGFRITGGVFFSPNHFKGKASAVGQRVRIGSHTYTMKPNDAINGTLDYNSCYPYIGLGWDWVIGEAHNYVIGLDLGVSYLGDPEVALTGSGKFGPSGSATADIAKEQKSLQKDADDYKFYPIMKLSFTYHF